MIKKLRRQERQLSNRVKQNTKNKVKYEETLVEVKHAYNNINTSAGQLLNVVNQQCSRLELEDSEEYDESGLDSENEPASLRQLKRRCRKRQQ
jgi:hypothetical protein